MLAARGLLLLTVCAALAAAQCSFGTPGEGQHVDLSQWVELPTGSGDWTVLGDHSSATQRRSSVSTFLISDSDMQDSDFLKVKVRAGAEDGLFGFVFGLACLPEHSGSILACDNDITPQVVWGRGTEDTTPGLCAQMNRFPSMAACPVEEPSCSSQCSNMNRADNGSPGYGPGLPVYADQAMFTTGFLACCDRFCGGCGGQGWIADQDYDIVLHYTPERLVAFFNNLRLFDYRPARTLDAPLPIGRVGFSTTSHSRRDVDFLRTRKLSTGTVGCPSNPWTYVLTINADTCSDSEMLTIDYGDGTPVQSLPVVAGMHPIDLSHVYYATPPQGVFGVRCTLQARERDVRATIYAYVADPVSIGTSTEPLGSCGFTSRCEDPYGVLHLDYVLGGSGPYAVVWSTGRTDVLQYECSPANCPDIQLTGLQPGTYTATVTDSKGCMVTSEGVQITGSSVAITSMTSEVCGDIDVSLSSTARCAPLSYSWTATGASNTSNFDPTALSQSALSPGDYTVTVTDTNGCQASQTMELAFGFTTPQAGDTIVQGTYYTMRWEGYQRFTEGTATMTCPGHTYTLFQGDLYFNRAADFTFTLDVSTECYLEIVADVGCISTVEPIYYCSQADFAAGICGNY